MDRTKPRYFEKAQLKVITPVAGIHMQGVAGERLHLNVVELEPNTCLPVHEHPHEQMGYILSGTVEFELDGKRQTLEPHMGYFIPGGVPHGATTGEEGCVLLDLFSPPREDYAELQET